jgi:mannose-1-phosphate guanylyltransferase
MSSAMILAAGLGTRLRPLTEELPKPLVPVGDRPLVAHVAEQLARAGIERAVVNVHHLAEAFTPDARAYVPVELAVVHEPVLLGTAGGVANAAPLLGDGDVVLWNGDILAEVDVSLLLAAHERSGALATLAFARRPVGEGTIGLDEEGAVVRLRAERFGSEAIGGDFLGVHVIGRALRGALPREGCLVGDAYLPALRRGARLASFEVASPWRDVGTLAAYARANLDWLAPRGGRFIAPTAEVDPAVRVASSVVGEGARVEGSGDLVRCIVWPGARAEAPLADAVVTPRAVVASG